MKRYYAPSLDKGALDAEQSHHCAQVMRQNVGDHFGVFDGHGNEAKARITEIAKDEVKFTVLAKIPEVARARTAYDDTTGVLTARAEGRADFAEALTDDAGRDAFARWLTDFLGEEAKGPLKVVQAPGHRFTDHPQGYVSIVNLASVRDLAARSGRTLDPLRFRANLYVAGWPAWIENEAGPARVRLGTVEAEVFSPIVRCAATHVDPTTGERDFDLVPALHEHYGHLNCGVYVSVTEGGSIAEGDTAEIVPGAV